MSELSEMISLRMGVKFANSLNICEKLPQKLHVKTCRNVYIDLVMFHINYIIFIQNNEILNRNHDCTMLRSK